MNRIDLSTRSVVSRRALLCAAPVMLMVGCTSATEQLRQRFFAAVKADPLFTWRPDWTTFDNSGPISYAEPFTTDTGAELDRLIGGTPVPKGAMQAATDVAVALGWSPERTFFLGKTLQTKGGPVRARVQISVAEDYSSMLFAFGMRVGEP
jgi:hypothetical protein